MKHQKFHIKQSPYSKGLLSASLLLGSASVLAQSTAEYARQFKGVVGKTTADSKEAWPQNPKAPQGAPNVVWILIDDVGFGASTTFGGSISTPVLDSLAGQGLRFTNFHTCAISAPTRAALLTGRNHHSVHEGGFSHEFMSAGFPGYDGHIPSEAGTIAEILRDNGYNTFAVGKYGITPDEDATDAGPFDRWPSGKGFEHFFGFLGSQTDQYSPNLVEEHRHVKPDGRHLSEQITDKAISYIDRQKKAAPNKPFFLYYAPGATHAPHQVATEWSDRYKGRFDRGWDVYREETFKRQKALGVIPENAVLPDRNPNIQAWSKLTPDQKKLYARFMEVYAGYLTYTDYEIGRLVQHLKSIGQLDNTLILVVIGDNGASKEGTQNGVIEGDFEKILAETDAVSTNLSKIGLIGEKTGTQVNYPLGWAQAANTPFKYWKQDANSEGGTRNPLIAFYPKGISDKGGIRNQYGHVIDLLPTTLEVTGITAPEFIRGVKQDTIQGSSLAYAFSDKKALSRHTTQYYFIFGARAIYQDGWKAALPFVSKSNLKSGEKPASEEWELYHLDEDPTERLNVAKQFPEKLAQLKALFEAQAVQYGIQPIITWDQLYQLKGKKFTTPKSVEKNFNAIAGPTTLY
jgi:arylsulfatase A-like enzyme